MNLEDLTNSAALLTEWDMVIRLCLGFLAGAIIGFERTCRHQIAGLKTHILIAVGATLLMILSIWLPQSFNSLKNGDPGRIAAQVVSGIGFLGAGAIVRLGNNVKGLTTAASLWFIAAVGLAIGAGAYIAALTAEVLSLFTLITLDFFEKRIFPSERTKLLELGYKDSIPDTQEAMRILKLFGVRVISIDVDQPKGKRKGGTLKLLVAVPVTVDVSKLAITLKDSGNVEHFEIKEKY
ncbi:MAG: MgtC/SapB family protein [Spirochaetaceae bacterium]|jgi:putative Mg2+ transporter-C (MgtC) family protein|nr:MgtC/SapB family protein [Spirochaetaceae bacterium]